MKDRIWEGLDKSKILKEFEEFYVSETKELTLSEPSKINIIKDSLEDKLDLEESNAIKT